MRRTAGLALVLTIGCGASRSLEPDGFDQAGEDGSTFNLDSDITPGFETGSGFSQIDPINATVFIDTSKTPLVGGTQVFTLKSGTGEDISASATWSVSPPDLGSFSGNTFTSVTDLGGALGRTGLVTAEGSGVIGNAKITVVKLRKNEDPVTKAKDFFFEEPYLGEPSPKEDVLKFTTQINQVDVAFVMDTSGSMGGEMGNLQTSIKGTLIPELRKQIPSVGIGIAGHDDYPYGGYGSSGSCTGVFAGDLPVYVTERITTDEAKAKAAVDRLRLCYGGDGPESQVPAMWHVLTGKALSWSGGSVAAHTPPAGFTGGMNFRAGAVPVLVLITDADWHNGVGAAYSGIAGAPTAAGLAAEFKKAGAKFVSVNTLTSAYADANSFSDATGSSVLPSAFGACPSGSGCCTGTGGAGVAPTGPGGKCRLNFIASSAGTGVGASVVTAIKAIASGSVYDLLPEVTNDPTNADGVDAVAAFMDRLEAAKPGDPGVPAECAGTPRKSVPSMAYNDMIGGITAGKQVACFRVIPKKNETVPPKEAALFFKAFIKMRGVSPGTAVTPTTPTIDLGDRREVLFYVPPKPPIAK